MPLLLKSKWRSFSWWAKKIYAARLYPRDLPIRLSLMFKWNIESSCILKSWFKNNKPRFCRRFVERLSFNDRIPRRFDMELLNFAEKLSSRLLCEKSKVRSWRESIEDIDLQRVIVSCVVILLSLLGMGIRTIKNGLEKGRRKDCWINIMYLSLSERLLSYVYVFKNCERD